MRCKWWGVRILVAILAFGIVWGGMPAQLVRAQDAETATPYAYVVKDGEKLNVILYEALKNSYFAYRSNPDRHEARLAKYYMGLLRSAASSGKKVDEVIISYVSSISRQHVDYRKLADKYMALRRKAKPTYAWLNSWTADAGRIANKYVEVINDDRIVQYGYWLDADGYRLETQVAPTGLTGVAPTTGANNDGKITGVNTTMEYKLKSASPWNAVTGTVITGLASGTYEVRYKAKPGYAASPATQVVVPPYVPKPIVEAITITATVAGNPYNPDYSLPNNEGVTVKLETATTGAEIYYTLDGTTPTADSEKYDNEIIVDSSALDEPANGGTVVLKAIAVKSGHTNSAVATLEIEFDAAAPKYTVTFSVVGGNGELEAAIQNPFGWENVTSGDKVDGGLDVIFTATPDPGYQVKEWKKDGVVVGDAGTTYTVADLAADVEVTVEFKLIVSTYQYVYELPDEDILAMVGFDFDLATENVLVGTQGYARALNRISLEGPGSLTFVGKDSLGHEITQVIDEDNDGYWGPLSGFPLPAEIPTGEMANTFNLTFSEAGDYTVRVWLEDLDTGAVITELEEDIEVKADTTPPVASKLHYQYNPYIGGDNYGSLVTVEENIVNDEATLVFWQRDILHRLSIEVTDDNLDETDVTVYRLDYNGQPKVDWGTLKYDSVSGVFELDMTPFEALDGSDPEALALATLQDGNKLQATFKDSFGNETVVTVTVEIPQITVSALDENYYAAGDTLSFTISGLRPNQEVRVGMPIWTGASGWPWASSKLVLTTGMVGDDTERYWVGTTNEDGELLVSGEVGSGLPYGELHITLPDYDVFIDNNIRLQDEQGDPVYVGVLSDKAKADFLAKLAAEAAAITASGVADVELDEEDITVTFMSNASPGAIYDAAEDLLGVFKDELQAASMTITRAGESTGQTFDLHAAGVVEAVAGYLLNGMSPAEFLAQRDPILATYTATATDKYGVEFDLAGDLVFAVEATPDKAKADFLAKLAAEAAAITASGVADVELDEEDITVTFMSNASPGAIYDAAEDLLGVFKDELQAASMTITRAGESTGQTFDLHAAGVVEAVAGYLLNGMSPAEFLAQRDPILATYTATATDKYGVEFDLAGDLVFAVEATPDKAKADFLAKLAAEAAAITASGVADVELDEEDITVTFMSDASPGAIYDAAEDLLGVFKDELQAASMTITRAGESTGQTFDLHAAGVVEAVAGYLLNGMSPAEFLAQRDPILATYTATATDKYGVEFDLAGDLVFAVEATPDKAKADFLAKLAAEAAAITASGVADVELDEEDITVTFMSDASPGAIYDAAEDLLGVFKDELQAASMTITRAGESTGQTFDLHAAGVVEAVAGYLLNGMSPAEFLAQRDPILATYTATATDKYGVEFDLAGDLVFAVEATPDKAKADFLAKLAAEAAAITASGVADVELDEEDITVTFMGDASPGAIYDAAEDLLGVFKDELQAASMTITRAGESTGQTFDLHAAGVVEAVAGYLLNGMSPAEFLAQRDPILATYTATATDKYGVEFDLAGDLVFAVEATPDKAKADFLAKLAAEAAAITASGVADVELDEEDITVTFMSDASPGAIYDAAEDLLGVFKDELQAASMTITRAGESTGQTFDLHAAGVVEAVAGYLLNGMSPAEFLAQRDPILATYTATATDKYGVEFDLAGDLVFAVEATPDKAKADFLAKLAAEAAAITASGVADVELDEEDITVTFMSDASPGAIYDAAEDLLAVFQAELSEASMTIELADGTERTFDLRDAGVVELVANFLLDGMTPEQFLSQREPIEASYTATAKDKYGVEFDLAGDLVFAVEATSGKAKADFLAILEIEAGLITAADVVVDEEDITATFMSDAAVGAVHQAASDLLAVFQAELSEASMTIELADGTEGTFNLRDAGVVELVANFLLNGMSPAEFLAQRDPILATYTATATDKYGVEFDLAGDLVFAVEATSGKAKADFLAILEIEAGLITAADVVVDEEDITATFMSDAAVGAVHQAASDLLAVFQAELSEASMTVELADGTEGTFNLRDAGVVELVANFLLNGMTPEQFLSQREPIEASYTATATDKYGVEFDLAGDLVFAVEATPDKAKADFLAILEIEAGLITAADVVVDEEDITATFMSDAAVGAVHQAASDLLAVFQAELSEASMTIELADGTERTFDLRDAGVVELVANFLLDGMTPEQFLSQRDPILATYTATATDKYGVEFDLAGDLVFAVEATPDKAKADFLATLNTEAGNITVAAVEIDGENISITFSGDAVSGAIYNAAAALLRIFQDELQAASMTIELADGTEGIFNLRDAGVVELVANFLLDGMTPEQFLSQREPIEASYTATATDKYGVEFTLGGDLSFVVAELDIYETTTLNQNFGAVNVWGSDIEVNLGGYTVQALTVYGNNVTLKNGTILNLTIEAGVENVTLEDILDGAGGVHIFAGGGEGSVILGGSTLIRGTVNITSLTPLQIRSESEGSQIAGKLIIKNLTPLTINVPVQEVEVLVNNLSIAIKKQVEKIVVLADTIIKVDASIGAIPVLEVAPGVNASVLIVDKYGIETGESVSPVTNEDLIPTDTSLAIIGVSDIAKSVVVNGDFVLPTTVEALYGDGQTKSVDVSWAPSVADTSVAGTFIFTGSIPNYEGQVELILSVLDKDEYEEYFVTFENWDGTLLKSEVVRAGGKATAPIVPARKGYTFTDWDKSFDNVISDLTVTAQYQIKEYAIAYELDDGINNEANPSTHTIESDTIMLQPATKEGYTFDGWYDAETGGDKVTGIGKDYTGDVTLYARWKINKYTITFYDENGSTELETLEVEYNTMPAPTVTPTKAATAEYTYAFAGWDPELVVATEATSYKATYAATAVEYTLTWVVDGVETKETYAFGATITPLADPTKTGYTFDGWDPVVPGTMPAENITITAKWKINKYTITFYDENGSTELETLEVEYNTMPVPTVTPTKAATAEYTYAFAGWDPELVVATEATSYKATYAATAVEYTLTWVVDGVETKETYAFGATITPLADPTKTGYTFDGWDPVVPGTMPAENITITAKWKINKYTITFYDENGSTELETLEVEYNTMPAPTVTPTKAATAEYTYAFAGWDPELVVATEATSYKATYAATAVEYTLTWVVDGVETKETYAFGATITPLADPTKTGYTFDGWDPVVPGTMPAENITITAKWKINKYTITFYDENGSTELETLEVEYNTMPAPTVTPTKAATAEYTYAFAGWDPELVVATEATSYKATYAATAVEYTLTWVVDGVETKETYAFGATITPLADPTKTGYTFDGWDPVVPGTMPAENITITAKWKINKYTITFYDENGSTELETLEVEYNTMPAPTVTPTKAATAEYTYAFAGWDPELVVATEATSYKATYAATAVEYTLTWVVDGVETKETYAFGATITPLADPTKTGYTFDGWDPVVPGTMPAENITITAKWKINKYTITFYDENGSTELETLEVEYNTMPAPTVTPTKAATAEYTYAFAGWDPELVVATEATSYKATYAATAVEYTLTWVVDGVETKETYAFGATITPLADPTKTGYTFDGWDPVVPGTMPAENITITAKWKINKYTITFYDENGSTELETLEVEYNTMPAPTVTPTKAATAEYTYAFAGWDPELVVATEATSYKATYAATAVEYTLTWVVDGVETKETYAFGATITPLADPTKTGYTFDGWDPVVPGTMPAENITITAKWKINKYTITFYDENGSTELETLEVEYNTMPAPTVTPTKAATAEYTYAFAGWDPELVVATEATSYKATYAATAVEYTLTWVVDGVETKETYAFGATITPLADPTKTGYTFDGWDPVVPGTMPAENITITAKWKINKYTITFYDENGSTELETLEVEYNTMPAPTVTPTKAATAEYTYAFAGWDPELVVATEATSYKATYAATAVEYTLTWVVDGVETKETYAFGATITPLADPTKTGYTFDGWDPVVPGTMPAENITITAKWKAVEYTITYELDGGTNHGDNPGKYTIETETITLEPATKEGYDFVGWYDAQTGGNKVTQIPQGSTGSKVLYARWIDQLIVGFQSLTEESGERVRPSYTLEEGTHTKTDWDLYWGQFQTALTSAQTLYDELKDTGTLTPQEKASINAASAALEREAEILDGIEDFDSAWGGRENPLGLVETVYARSLVADSFQPGRLRCYYEKEDSHLYWLLSGFLQGQGYYAGTTGTGMNPGLQNVMRSEALWQMKSGDKTVEIYNPDGTRKSQADLESEGINLAWSWLSFETGTYVDFVDFNIDCQLIGKTSDDTEFERTYSFSFLDAGIHLFEPEFRYCVANGNVQRVFGDYIIINVTQDIGYTDSTIQAAIDAASAGDKIYIASGSFNESVTIDKSITLVGSYMAGDTYPTVLTGSGLGNVPGITINSGVNDVTITGFEIANFGASGITAQGDGIDNVTIGRNYIHNVGADGIHGNSGASQVLSGWTLESNIISGYGSSGIKLVNVADSTVSKNKITGTGNSVAIEVGGQSDSGSVTVETVSIENNVIDDADVRVTASGTATTQNITVSKNTVNNGKITALADAGSSSGATVKSITIKDNTLSGSSAGIDVRKQGSGTASLKSFTISNNKLTIHNPVATGSAVNLADVGVTSTFTKNEITISGSGGANFDGVSISGGATGKWTISNNELDGGEVGLASSGIRLSSSLPSTAQVIMTRTKVTGWAQGIKSDNLAVNTKVEIRQSWIEGNTAYGIQNGSGAKIDAILNYWGDVSGPYHATTNTGGQGNAVSDHVDYNPWHQDEEFVSLSDGTVHNETQDKYYHSIQTAIDEADAGDVIQVAAGLYFEEVQVKKSVILRGDIGDPDEAGCGVNAPIIDGTGAGFTKCGFQIRCAGDVVIEGFEIRNFEYEGLDNYSSSSNVTFRYNYIHDVNSSEYARGGAFAHKASAWEVTHNRIENAKYGITIGEDVTDCVFDRNKIRDISDDGIHLQVQNVTSTPLTASGVTISNNEITSVGGKGIYILAYPNSGAVTIEDISISGNTVTTNGDNAILLWEYGSGIRELKDIRIANNTLETTNNGDQPVIFIPEKIENIAITGNDITLKYGSGDAAYAVSNLHRVHGTGIFSSNTVKVIGQGNGIMFWFRRTATADWIIDNNIFIGPGSGTAIDMWNSSGGAKLTLSMTGNTVTGWNNGALLEGMISPATLRSNRIHGNNNWAVINYDSVSVDAELNYWGDESGPYHETANPDGLGNGVGNNIDFDPWYIDIECTTTNNQEAMDQQHVGEAIALVPDPIAQVVVSGGENAGAEAKKAAVKAHIESLEGMAALGVTVAVTEGSTSGYKITITKGEAEDSKDNVQVTAFVVPPADQEAANAVSLLIDPLPLAGSLNLENFLDKLAAIEEAEAAYEALTEAQKALVNPYLVGKLNDTVAKAESLVLDELDGRIDDAIGELHLIGTGIEEVQFDNRAATLIVDDPDKKVHEFVQSGVVNLFQSMFQDVVEMRLGEDETWYGVDGTNSQGAMEAGAHIVAVLLGLNYQYGQSFGGVFNQLAAADLGQLIGKDLEIQVRIERLEGGKKYEGTYTIAFAAGEGIQQAPFNPMAAVAEDPEEAMPEGGLAEPPGEDGMEEGLGQVEEGGGDDAGEGSSNGDGEGDEGECFEAGGDSSAEG